MGLERLAAILQHVHSNYEIDIFDKLIKAAGRETGTADLSKSLRSDCRPHPRHGLPGERRRDCLATRAAAMCSAASCAAPSATATSWAEDAVFPQTGARPGAHDGRRLPQHGRPASSASPTCCGRRRALFRNAGHGMEILDEALAGGVKVLPGDVAFKLHDTYGFPLDLSADVCRERNLRWMKKASKPPWSAEGGKGRAAGKFKMDKALEYTGAGNAFRATTTCSNRQIVAVYVDGTSVEAETGPKRRGGAGHHPVLFRERWPGGRPGRSCDQRRASSRWVTPENQGRCVWPPWHADQGTLAVGDTVNAQVDMHRCAPPPCATTAPPT
jgi:alanyl-tRNA synthetase